MSKWSRLVYSRTYEVDFRLIATPETFTEQDKQWASKYILGTTRSPEKLLEQPRWSLFKNEHYCVIGVTCMARELIQGSKNANVEDMTKDSGNRPVYVFVGYVADLNREQGLPLIPKYLDKNLELFAPLYEYVQQRWFVKAYEPESRAPILSKDEELNYIAAQPLVNLDKDYFDLNQLDKQKIRLWPDENKENVWSNTAQQISDFPNKSISLCLSLSGQRDAVDSPFLNATAFGIRQKEDISKNKELSIPREASASASTNIARVRSVPTNEYRVDEYLDVENDERKKESALEPVEILGAILGGLVGSRIVQIPGFLFGSGVIGFVVGAGIGWVTAGCITNKGIGGAVAKQTRDFLDDVTNSGNQGRKRRSPARQDSKQQDIGYGFRTHNEQNNSGENPQNNSGENPQNNDSNWF